MPNVGGVQLTAKRIPENIRTANSNIQELLARKSQTASHVEPTGMLSVDLIVRR